MVSVLKQDIPSYVCKLQLNGRISSLGYSFSDTVDILFTVSTF